MSIFLAGQGESGENPAVIAGFLGEAQRLATSAGRTRPRIAVVVVADEHSTYGTPAERVAGITELLSAHGAADVVPVTAPEGGVVEASLCAHNDGILVAGGHTPSYAAALGASATVIRDLVSGGAPYLGFSAGAAIVAERALVGGWLIGGVPVAPEAASENRAEVSIVEGLGLIDLTVDVHAAQWGTLTRVIAAVEAGLITEGIAIDENTALVVGQGALRVVGSGSVWRVRASEAGVLVSSLGATE
ncbi:cyanophycinase [Klugiella xanthotipulae]|uniref:Cyanophycinase n=1 Tax=Klugiella xanthotipulae TaxID=244735 RepID=A0A543I4S7_9MICO|nr:Type 1 glutamine amidotransferase-like domain-containing protein [Klugiella xanthotipulae]TQM65564.1 cyanophycinase [Klugiella xanthotipulae]